MNAPAPLAGTRVLVVEDNYLLASSVEYLLRAAGAEVVGCAGNCRDALALLEAGHAAIDVGLLDVHLVDEHSYPVADALRARGIPFVFATGYEADVLDPDYRDVPLCMKPYAPESLVAALRAALGRPR